MKKWQIVVLVIAIAALAAGIGAYAATSYGTQTDPLITLSYITGKLEPSIREDFDSKLNTAVEKLERDFESELATATGSFKTISLAAGDSLEGAAGCEILLRSGTASAIGSLVDVTGGGALASGGALAANHLYLASDSGAGVKVTADAVLLVRGTYKTGNG